MPSNAKHNRDLALAQQSETPTLDQQNSKFLAMLRANNLQLKSNAAKIISRSMNIDQKIYAEIESQLLNNYQSADGDKKLIDLMAWYCKALASSGRPEFKPTVETVYNKTENSKLKKYAKLSLDYFDLNAKKHVEIAKYRKLGLDNESAVIIADLKSEYMFTKIKACKMILASETVNPEVFKVVAQVLLFGLTQQLVEESYGDSSDDEQSRSILWKVSQGGNYMLNYGMSYDETMSMLCKALSVSGNAAYRETLKKCFIRQIAARLKNMQK